MRGTVLLTQHKTHNPLLLSSFRLEHEMDGTVPYISEVEVQDSWVYVYEYILTRYTYRHTYLFGHEVSICVELLGGVHFGP